LQVFENFRGMKSAGGVSLVNDGHFWPAAQRLTFNFMNTASPKTTFTPSITRQIFILATAASLLLIAACGPSASKQAGREDSPSVAANNGVTDKERVAAITKQLSQSGKLPGILLDAQFLEEKAGDGVLGPSDFFAFYALTVPPADIPAWRTALAASPVDKGTEAYAAPKAATPWWVTQADYQKLELYGPKSLTGRSHGWVKLSPDGRIFIYAFTL
jgi:hypothetical protein